MCRLCNKKHPRGERHKCGSKKLAKLAKAKLRRTADSITDANVPATAATEAADNRRSKKKKLEELGLTEGKPLKVPLQDCCRRTVAKPRKEKLKTVPMSDVIYD